MIHFELNQTRLRGGQKLPAAVVDKTLRACAKAMKFSAEVMISIAFVSPAEMKKLNKTWRGKDGLTDVLSFGSLTDGDGEILLSYEQAVKQAKEMKHSVRDELVFLLVHGVLHLSGLDHIEPKDAKKMFPLQTKILEELGVDPRI